jgi:hypothetical protein
MSQACLLHAAEVEGPEWIDLADNAARLPRDSQRQRVRRVCIEVDCCLSSVEATTINGPLEYHLEYLFFMFGSMRGGVNVS